MSKREEQYPDVAAVRAQARNEWEERIKQTVSVQERIGESVPWWLVAIAAVFFTLSVPHTATVFERITPNFGYVAPIGVEFGLLYAAFRRKRSRKTTAYLITFEVLLFIMAVIANGAGSFIAVVDRTRDIQGMPFEDILSQYRTLPAKSQLSLLLAPLAAFIIPIGTAVAGEGLAALFLERRETGDLLETRWQQDRPMVEFEALRDAAIALGITPGRAQKWAETIAFYQRADVSGHGGRVSATDATGQTPDTSGRITHQRADVSGHGTGRGYSKRMDARARVRQHLEDNPDDADLSVRALADMVGVGKTTAADVRNEYRASRNGHGQA
jgi:hypothetical protein